MEIFGYTQEVIIKGCISNERKYQELLYRFFFPKMVAMCRRYTSDEDYLISIVNDGMVRVYKNIGKYEGKGSFEGWIRRIVQRSLASHFRKENVYLKNVYFSELELNGSVGSEHKLNYEDLVRVIERLPRTTKDIFEMHAIKGYSHKEISEAMGIAEGTSRWHVSIGRAKIKELIKEIDI